MNKTLKRILHTFWAIIGHYAIVFSQTQAYTTTFGNESDLETVTGAVEDAQGRLLVCGWTNYDPGESNSTRGFVFRLTPTKQLDNSFGTNGATYIDFPNSSDDVKAIALNSNGDIFLAGSTDNTVTPCVFKLNGTDGKLATNFGNGGRAILQQAAKFENLLILPNQKIIAVGWGIIVLNQDANYIVAQFTVNGQVDATFGTNSGFTHVEFEDDDYAKYIVRQSDGSLVVAGESWTCSSSSCNDFSITRLLPNGQLDNGFDKKLYKTSPQSSSVSIDGLGLQKVGTEERIVISGIDDIYPFLFRLRDNGNNDGNFGSNGYKKNTSSGLTGRLAMQADNKILFGIEPNIIQRIKPDASLDNTFGNGGIFKYALPPNALGVNFNVLIAPGNTIYALGTFVIGSNTDIFVVKINNTNVVSTESPDARTIGLEVFPNPSDGNAMIRFQSEEGGSAHVRVLDLSGRLVYQKEAYLAVGQAQTIDLPLGGQLAPGTYMVQVQTGRRFANKKWVVE